MRAKGTIFYFGIFGYEITGKNQKKAKEEVLQKINGRYRLSYNEEKEIEQKYHCSLFAIY